MKILISAHTFFPNLGGIETFTHTLANAFVALGHSVTVITPVVDSSNRQYSYNIVRKPGLKKIIDLFLWCDIFYQSNISLKSAWPLLFIHKPYFITHHIWIAGGKNNKLRLRDRLKQWVCRFAKNIAISQFIANTLTVPSTIIYDPYDDSIFDVPNQNNISRNKELLFVGRLEKEKGVHIALEALSILQKKEVYPKLTIIGTGSEEITLKTLCHTLGLSKQVSFIGPMHGNALAEQMRQHLIMLVPSIWNEPFGIVALEGIASGCFVIGSSGGGMAEAIGECGITFQNSNSQELSLKIEYFLKNKQIISNFLERSNKHLEQFKPMIIANRYLKEFQK